MLPSTVKPKPISSGRLDVDCSAGSGGLRRGRQHPRVNDDGLHLASAVFRRQSVTRMVPSRLDVVAHTPAWRVTVRADAAIPRRYSAPPWEVSAAAGRHTCQLSSNASAARSS